MAAGRIFTKLKGRCSRCRLAAIQRSWAAPNLSPAAMFSLIRPARRVAYSGLPKSVGMQDQITAPLRPAS
jgi:hypothetical protein